MDKEKQIEDLKKLYSETKDLNLQYFKNILQLRKDYSILEFVCIFELITIIVLGLIILL